MNLLLSRSFLARSALICISLPLALTACDGNGGNGGDQKFTYDYTQNGCQTLKHDFTSKDAYCAGLKDDELNHGCALSLRASAYRSDSCPGEFTTVNPSGPDSGPATTDLNFICKVDAPGCSTGLLSFTEKADYCEALEDGALNSDCGLSGRADLYAKDCGPDFDPVPGKVRFSVTQTSLANGLTANEHGAVEGSATGSLEFTAEDSLSLDRFDWTNTQMAGLSAAFNTVSSECQLKEAVLMPANHQRDVPLAMSFKTSDATIATASELKDFCDILVRGMHQPNANGPAYRIYLYSVPYRRSTADKKPATVTSVAIEVTVR